MATKPMRPKKTVSQAESRQDLRARVIRAAIDLYAELGVAGTSLGQIATKAAISQPLMYYHFPTPASLNEAVVNFMLEDLRQASVTGIESGKADPVKSLKGYASAPMVWATERKKFFTVWMYFYYLASFDERFAALNSTIRKTGRERILLLLQQCAESPKYGGKKHTSLTEAALRIQTAITGFTIMFGTEGKTTGYTCAKALEDTIERELSEIFGA